MSWLPDSATAAKWKEYSITGTVIDRTPPPSPYGLTTKRLHNVAVELSWKADADIESGIKHFNIYNGNQLIGRFPEHRSEEHTSELQSLMHNSYAVFLLKTKTKEHKQKN